MSDFDQSISEIADAPQDDFDAAIAQIRREYAIAWENDRPMRVEAFRDDLRETVLDALDKCFTIHKIDPIKDRELPQLFAYLEQFCERVQ